MMKFLLFLGLFGVALTGMAMDCEGPLLVTDGEVEELGDFLRSNPEVLGDVEVAWVRSTSTSASYLDFDGDCMDKTVEAKFDIEYHAAPDDDPLWAPADAAGAVCQAEVTVVKEETHGHHYRKYSYTIVPVDGSADCRKVETGDGG